MNVGVFGTGMVGRTLAEKLSALGHSLKVGTRDVQATLARNEKGQGGSPPLKTWLESHRSISLASFEDAARHGELLVNALSGGGALPGLEQAGAANLAGKVLIDISNPLDFSRGMPPSLTISNTDSLGETIQRTFPEARVVKSLNTVNAHLMVDAGQLAGGDHTMFVAGNDAAAKATVTALLKDGFGWKDVIDLGDITMARGTEMYLPIWVRLWGALKTPMFNVKVVRG